MDRLPSSHNASARGSPVSSALHPPTVAGAQPEAITGPQTSRPVQRLSQSRLRSSAGDLSARQKASSRSEGSKRSKDSLKSIKPNTPDPTPHVVGDVGLVDLLKGELEGIRNIITCKICFSLLYEPYTTACGHTFCYNCFVKTFEPHKPKNCPECRTPIQRPPAPAFLVREITHLFIAKAELLPEDETVQLHSENLHEHAQIVKKDRESAAGLFRGLFHINTISRGGQWCPMCRNRFQDNLCPHCGFDRDGLSVFEVPDSLADSDITTSASGDLDDLEMDDDDGFGSSYGTEEYDEEIEYGAINAWHGDEEMGFTLNRYLGAPGGFSAFSGSSSFPLSSASTYSEMDILEELEEEDEEDEGDETADDSSNHLLSISDDASAEETTPTDENDSVSQSEFSTQFGAMQEEESNVPSPTGSSDYSSARSEPSVDESVPHSGNVRRRQRESNTPTSNAPDDRRQRRRTGSNGHLTLPSLSPSLSQATNQISNSRESSMAATALPSVPMPVLRENSGSPSGEYQPQPHRAWNSFSGTRNGINRGPMNNMQPSIARLRNVTSTGQRAGSRSIEEDEGGSDDESDAQTTVGSGPSTPATSLARRSGSLTPVADSVPTTAMQVRHAHSRPSGNTRIRRQPSIIAAPSHHDDNDADVDESDVDSNGDVNMHGNSLRSRASQNLRRQPSAIRMRSNSTDDSDGPESPGNQQRFSVRQHLRPRQQVDRTIQQRFEALRDLAPPMSPSGGRILNLSPRQHNRLNRTDARGVTPQQSPRRQNLTHSSPMDGASNLDGIVGNSTRSSGQNAREMADRPLSRVGRPPSASGHRRHTSRAGGNGLQHTTPAANIGVPLQINLNPFLTMASQRQQLSNQPSVVPLRTDLSTGRAMHHQSSRTNMRGSMQEQSLYSPQRPQSRSTARNHQRASGSHSLNHTPSILHLPQAQGGVNLVTHAGTSAGRQMGSVSTMNNDSQYQERIQGAMDRQQQEISSRDHNQLHWMPDLYPSSDLNAIRASARNNPFRRPSTSGGGPFQPPPGNFESPVGTVQNRRSRNNLRLSNGPPGMLFSTSAGLNQSYSRSLAAQSQANNAPSTPSRLGNRRSNRRLNSSSEHSVPEFPWSNSQHIATSAHGRPSTSGALSRG